MKNDDFINAFNCIELDTMVDDKILKTLHQTTKRDTNIEKKYEFLLSVYFISMQIFKLIILLYIFNINFMLGILVLLISFYIECIVSILFYLLNKKSYVKEGI